MAKQRSWWGCFEYSGRIFAFDLHQKLYDDLSFREEGIAPNLCGFPHTNFEAFHILFSSRISCGQKSWVAQKFWGISLRSIPTDTWPGIFDPLNRHTLGSRVAPRREGLSCHSGVPSTAKQASDQVGSRRGASLLSLGPWLLLHSLLHW